VAYKQHTLINRYEYKDVRLQGSFLKGLHLQAPFFQCSCNDLLPPSIVISLVVCGQLDQHSL
jgi:hypothetical protein